ncbi:MAG: nickel pincer cofactor biosynthesis protein LarB [Deltaproteobacteria bacterium]|nr:nickel pincer cofactor biosynthesis protein LarB [Deltaproteobacteria bacterium]
MNQERLQKLLEEVRSGRVGIDRALETLRTLPYEDLGFAKIDHHRQLRKGFAEVVLGEGKSAPQIVTILKSLRARGGNALVTRVDALKAARVRRSIAAARYDPVSRTLVIRQEKIPRRGRGLILVMTAGTADIPVAEEAALTAELLGNEVERLFDVGVAGVHRLLDHLDDVRRAEVLIVCAGMEGALPSVVAGLVDCPVVGVPTSTGYGASFGGLAALLGMLNSCASGLTVVNIDNGFGAGFAAATMNRKA